MNCKKPDKKRLGLYIRDMVAWQQTQQERITKLTSFILTKQHVQIKIGDK